MRARLLEQPEAYGLLIGVILSGIMALVIGALT